MYLLDPETGQRRRHNIAVKADDATSRAGGTLAPLWERVSDTAKSFGATVAGGTAALGSGIAEKFEDVRDGGRRSARSLGEHTSEWGSSLADRLHQAGRRARRTAAESAPAQWFHREEPSHAGAYAGIGVGTLALGAAAMYLFDPQRGRQRRAQLVDQATSVCKRTGNVARQVGKDLRNRTTGYAHEARSWASWRGEPIGAEQLLQRVRSEMGHVVSHANAIQVMADGDGVVTLSGRVLASEVDALLTAVNKIPGVTQLINRLDVQDTVEGVTEVSTSYTQRL
jgi:hypothetical protein